MEVAAPVIRRCSLCIVSTTADGGLLFWFSLLFLVPPIVLETPIVLESAYTHY